MAKKKKGTLKDMVKAPRTIDIDGQLHMLAWITPEEGRTLKQLGGAGKKGPMGIPAYPPQDFGAARPDYADIQQSESGGASPNTGFVGGDQDDRDPYDPGERASDSYGKDQDLSIAGVQDTPTYGGLTEQQREDFADTRLGQRAQALEESGQSITGYKINPATGKVAGFMHTSPFSSGLASIYGTLTGQENVLGQVYSGDPSFDPFASNQYNNDGGGAEQRTPASAVSTVAAVEEEDTPLTEALKSYYAKGIGTATQPTSDLASLISTTTQATSSPVGGRYDPETGLYYLPDGTVIDIRTGKRVQPKRQPLTIKGLEMFKPVSA